jgi:hypothetical protein
MPVFPRRHDTQEFTPAESTGLRQQLAEARAAAGAAGLWVLESRVGEDGSLQRTPLTPLPFRIGRAAGLELALPSSHVSKTHAEIYSDGLALRVRDLGSRNGTFVNGRRIRYAELLPGDEVLAGSTYLVFRTSQDALGRPAG